MVNAVASLVNRIICLPFICKNEKQRSLLVSFPLYWKKDVFLVGCCKTFKLNSYTIMKTTYHLLLCTLITGCNISDVQTTKRTTTKTITEHLAPADSFQVWVNVDYLKSLESGTSICNCWKQNRYQLAYFDTSKMELFLQSNLMHFGHDSGFTIPIKKTGNRYTPDTTRYNWPVEHKEFEILDADTLVLTEGKITYKFIEKSFPKKTNTKTNSPLTDFDFTMLVYQLNSHAILNYMHLVPERSSSVLIDPDSLKNLIKQGKVNAHCSDDYYFDGMTIDAGNLRYFDLQFNKNELIIYENEGRGRFQKRDLSTLPKQVMSKN